MLELHQTRPAPHAGAQEQSVASLLPWASSAGLKQYTSRPNTLPPLRTTTSSALSFAPSSKPIFSSGVEAPPTPPETMMNAVSVRGSLHPPGHLGLAAGESARYSGYAHGPQAQVSSFTPPASAASYRTGHYSTHSTSQPTGNAGASTVYNGALQPLSSSLDQPAPKSSPIDCPVAPDLRVPADVDTPQKSMPQLAAEVTCLFWFENGSNLRKIAESQAPATLPMPYIPDAKPTAGFRKWVATLLSTTQVKQNVVLLALLFIYRLKKANPAVKGKPGSEYRLLTVALMLGNKFLDDNTYTNKTWADVSGISAHEVHIMEVEFLSNMRYSLYVSEAEWRAWHIALGRFGTYISRAIQSWDSASRAMPQLTSNFQVPAPLPSPPASSMASPQVFGVASPSHVTRSSTPLLYPAICSTSVSPTRAQPELDLRQTLRKRSYDDSASEPPAKRHAPNFLHQLPQPVVSNPSQLRGTVPSMAIPMTTSAPITTQTTLSLAPQLPQPPRAMSMVYQPAAGWSQAVSVPPSIAPIQTSSLTVSNGTQSRQLSPFPNSAGSSPVSATFPSAGTPYGHGRLSPSYYLAKRSSPYRPVRRPQTLLAPPPPMALNNASRQINSNQMQYHSLGRPMNERHHGQLPYNGWSHAYSWTGLPPPASAASRP